MDSARVPRSLGRVASALALFAIVLLLSLVPTSASGQAQGCVPDTETGCINGTIRTADGEPAQGITITADGPGGEQSAETNERGQWSIAVTEAGDYTVQLDEDTLPEGETLAAPDNNPQTVAVNLRSTRPAPFILGPPSSSPDSTPDAQETTEDAGDEGGDDGGAPGTEDQDPAADDEVGVAPEVAGASGSNRIIQYVASGIIFGLILAMASVGLSLIYGTTGLSNFSHGDLVTLGGVTAYIGVQWLGFSLWQAGIIAVAVGALMGYVQNTVLWAPLRRRGVGITQQMIVTIGLSMALQYTFLLTAGDYPLRIIQTNPRIFNIGPIRMTEYTLASVIIAIIVLSLVTYVLLFTRIGRATRAVSDNPALAAASGIKVESVVRMVWITGASLAALGGTMMGLYLNSTRWNMGAVLLLLMFAAVTLGGLGAAMGAIAGSFVIGLVVEMSPLILPNDLRYASALVILILVLLIRPQGILGRAERVG